MIAHHINQRDKIHLIKSQPFYMASLTFVGNQTSLAVPMAKMAQEVFIYDTTLRDGTQGEGFFLSGLDKLRLAQRLDEFGVDYIEGGWPGSNPKDIEFFQKAKDIEWQHAKVVAFGSTRRVGVDASADPQLALLLEAETPAVTIYGKTWDLHVTEVLRTTLEENKAMIYDTVQFLKQAGREVFFDAEHFFDGYKNNAAYAIQCIQEAARAGADGVVLCDTNGGTLPYEVTQICAAVSEALGETAFGIHTHNDCELGVANAIAAVQAGATQVQGTINGYGERTGNCNLTSVIPILQLKLGIEVVPHLDKLKLLSFFVDDLSNNAHFSRAPFIGQTAFAHKGGTHVNAVKKLAESYEHIRPALVGNTQQILVSELAGQANILIAAERLGLPLEKGSAEAKDVLEMVKTREHEGYSYEAANGSLELLIRKAMSRYTDIWQLASYQCNYRESQEMEHPVCEASVKIRIVENDSWEHTAAEGHGVVNALDKALRKALRPSYPTIDDISLVDYKVRIIEGADATASKTRVLIVHTDGQKIWGTVGVSDSIIEASWIAISEGFDLYIQNCS